MLGEEEDEEAEDAGHRVPSGRRRVERRGDEDPRHGRACGFDGRGGDDRRGETARELIVERYFDRFDSCQASQTGLGRRVKRAAENADELEPSDVKPHGLRATAATRFAARGLDVIALQALFGWSQISTSQRYIRRSGEHTARAIRDTDLTVGVPFFTTFYSAESSLGFWDPPGQG